MSPRRAGAVWLAAALLAGCASAAPGGGAAGLARGAIAGLVADFQGGRAEAFFERVDRGSFPAFDAFRERVRDFLLRARQVTVAVVVDGAAEDGGEVAAQAHWDRSFVDGSGAYRLESGRCELVFARRPSGGLALAAIRGASPF